MSTTCTLNIQDSYGNPLPPRTLVSVLNATDPPGTTPIAMAYLGITSTATAALTLGGIYRVQYAGAAAPPLATFFVAAASVTIIPDRYVSPWANISGYAQQLGWVIPLGRTKQSELLPGGQFRVYLEVIGAMLAAMDKLDRTVSAGERLASSTAGQITSWVADFLGPVLPPFPNETDAAYIARIYAWLQQAFTTIPAIQAAVTSYFARFPDNSSSTLVFDRMTDPLRAAYYGLTTGQIAIAIYYGGVDWIDAWFIGQSFLGQNTRVQGPGVFVKSSTAPYDLLQQNVNQIKAGGAVPVYVTASGDPTNFGQWGEAWGLPWA